MRVYYGAEEEDNLMTLKRIQPTNVRMIDSALETGLLKPMQVKAM